MDINELVCGISDCECGRPHNCPIKSIIIESGAINSVATETAKYTRILLVADENTYALAGKQVENMLRMKISDNVIFPGEKILIPDERAIALIEERLNDKTELVLGIGSGVINDLCKYVSYKHGIPYHIVATAPSMDGYASKGAALILDGMKITVNADVPEVIIADVDILCSAPMDMIVGGYGDIIGKYSCLNDWKLANLVNGEYICERVMNAAYEEVLKTKKLACGLKKRNKHSVKALMEALVAVGILMAYVGNSRPASGSEHHLSHYFEIVGIVKREKYLSHGVDVFYSACETAKIREKLLMLESVDSVSKADFDEKVYEKNIKNIYSDVADEVIALQKKLGWYAESKSRVEIYKQNWEGIKAVLQEAPSFSDMKKMLEEVGMSYIDFEQYYGKDKIEAGVRYAKDLKDRYTVLWMWYDLLADCLE